MGEQQRIDCGARQANDYERRRTSTAGEQLRASTVGEHGWRATSGEHGGEQRCVSNDGWTVDHGGRRANVMTGGWRVGRQQASKQLGTNFLLLFASDCDVSYLQIYLWPS
jgi:hypothetical protein